MEDPSVCSSFMMEELQSALLGGGNGRNLEIFTIVVLSLIIGLGVVVIPTAFITFGVSFTDAPAPAPREGNPVQTPPSGFYYNNFDFNSDEFYIIHPVVADYVLEVEGECRNGANVRVGRQTGGSNADRQRFRSGQGRSIESVYCPGFVLEVGGGTRCNQGANIRLFSYNQGGNQNWGFDQDFGYIAPQYECDGELPTIGAAMGNGLSTGTNIELQRYDRSGTNLGQGWTLARAPNEDRCVRGRFETFSCGGSGDTESHKLAGLSVGAGRVVDFELLQGNYGSVTTIISQGSPQTFSEVFEQDLSLGVGDVLGDQADESGLSRTITFTTDEADTYNAWLYFSEICQERGAFYEYFASWRLCVRD